MLTEDLKRADESSHEEGAWPSISVCVLTCDRDLLLARLLRALVPQLEPCDEIVIIDTGDSGYTLRVVEQMGSAQIRYYGIKMQPFDFAAARNELLKLAHKEAIAFTDDDAIPLRGWLNEIRRGLKRHSAVGGVTLAQGSLPKWWDPAINWCVGLSPPGTILGQPGFYPDTCNMAARREMWKAYPFDQVPRQDRQLYVTGREDADWWMQRRLSGHNVKVNWRQAVSHYVHPSRMSMGYIKQRAYNDGVASWLRRPHYRGATDIPWDLAHIAGVVLDKFLMRPLDRKYRLEDVVWLRRQFGRFMAVWEETSDLRPPRREQLVQLLKAGVFQARIRAGRALFSAKKLMAQRGEFPPTAPGRIFVSADCLLGDSVLLRRHVYALAKTFPRIDIMLSCSYPAVFKGLADNIRILPTTVAAEEVREKRFLPDVAIVPYFLKGDYRLWRELLAEIGATFDCDVGFSGRRDYTLARMQIPKSMELHEHENLARLFRLWPLIEREEPPRLDVDLEAVTSMERQLEAHGISSPFVAVQLGSGMDSKSWPAGAWIKFLGKFIGETGRNIVLFGGADWAEAGDEVAASVGKGEQVKVGVLFGGPVEEIIALISRAELVIGGCSGPKHIAIELGIPTFTLYAASEPVRWGAAQDHDLHGYINALPQKLSGMELQNMQDDHRIRLLKADRVAEAAVAHWRYIKPD